jgi:exopolysaccharide biosynthesis polyprenyl glycosylphosphotransferase
MFADLSSLNFIRANVMSSYFSHSLRHQGLTLPATIEQQVRDLRSPAFITLRRGSAIKWLRVLAFIALDCILLFFAWQVSGIGNIYFDVYRDAKTSLVLSLPIMLAEIGVMATLGLYQAGSRRRDYLTVVKALTLVYAVCILVTVMEHPYQFDVQVSLLVLWLISLGFVCSGRFLADAAIHYVRRNGLVRHAAFILCEPGDASRISALLSREPHYEIVGWQNSQLLDDDRQALMKAMRSLGVSEVFLCSQLPTKDLMLLYWDLRNVGITLHLSFLLLDSKSPTSQLGSLQIPELVSFNCCPPLISGVDFWIKRISDFCAAVVFLLLTAPIYVVIALLIKLDSPGPIFYKQTRVGLRNRLFQLWKFRTMVVNADELQKQLETLNQSKDGILFKIKDDPRITRVGKFLRRYSLDELPQIFNVLLGEMSFVGPRPLPLRDVDKFSESHFIRHEVLPGITGLWQVSGRSDIENFEDVLSLDLSYIKDWSIRLDLRIILQTVKVVLQKTGAY